MSERFHLYHGDQLLSKHPSFWLAREAGVAYMRAHKVSPLQIIDTESTEPVEFRCSDLHIYAYEQPTNEPDPASII